MTQLDRQTSRSNMDGDNALLEGFRAEWAAFLMANGVPQQPTWEENGIVDSAFWRAAGSGGFLGVDVPTCYGGRGLTDFRFSAAVAEELVRADVSAPGVVSHNDVTASYIYNLGNDDQRKRWLPKLCAGLSVGAIAVTEPGGGSNSAQISSKATRRGGRFVLNGTKSYITNGVSADVVVVAVQTAESAKGAGLSLLVVERGMPGFGRGPIRKKLGWHASDTADLIFDNCEVPESSLLGRQNLGNLHFLRSMPRERLSISVVAVASAEQALAETIRYARKRESFGQPISSLQSNRFELARLQTELKLARVYVDHSIDLFNKGQLGMVEAAQLKFWTTELQVKLIDFCLQLHGASGYMADAKISRYWLNSRVQKIYGGTSEVMLEIISRSMAI